MYTTEIKEDITLHCIIATSFPDGVAAVWQQLHTRYPPGPEASYYGLSFPDANGGIHYRACVHLRNADVAKACTLPVFTVKKGLFICEDIPNFMTGVPKIGITFQELIHQPNVAKDGFCLEKYINPTDMICMVPLE